MLTGNGHSLRSVDDGVPDPEEMARYVEGIADPERPVAADVFAAMELSGQAPLRRWAGSASWPVPCSLSSA